jgi:hypothetical protein
MLSDSGRASLRGLLPPTAFSDYRERLGEDHPAFEDMESKPGSSSQGENSNAMVVDSQPEPELNLSVFTDPHFLAAARTFQDHLYFGWLTDAHVEKVRQFQAGVVSGEMAAPWKDEVWERDNPVIEALEPDVTPSASLSVERAGCVRFNFSFFFIKTDFKTRGASEVKLYTLAKKGIIRVGDVIAYKRTFATSEVVEKDIIVCQASFLTVIYLLIQFLGAIHPSQNTCPDHPYPTGASQVSPAASPHGPTPGN